MDFFLSFFRYCSSHTFKMVIARRKSWFIYSKMFDCTIPNYLTSMSSPINDTWAVFSLENSCFENSSIQISKYVISFPNFFNKLNSSPCVFIVKCPIFRWHYCIFWSCISLNTCCKTPGRIISRHHILNIY